MNPCCCCTCVCVCAGVCVWVYVWVDWPCLFTASFRRSKQTNVERFAKQIAEECVGNIPLSLSLSLPAPLLSLQPPLYASPCQLMHFVITYIKTNTNFVSPHLVLWKNCVQWDSSSFDRQNNGKWRLQGRQSIYRVSLGGEWKIMIK